MVGTASSAIRHRTRAIGARRTMQTSSWWFRPRVAVTVDTPSRCEACLRYVSALQLAFDRLPGVPEDRSERFEFVAGAGGAVELGEAAEGGVGGLVVGVPEQALYLRHGVARHMHRHRELADAELTLEAAVAGLADA